MYRNKKILILIYICFYDKVLSHVYYTNVSNIDRVENLNTNYRWFIKNVSWCFLDDYSILNNFENTFKQAFNMWEYYINLNFYKINCTDNKANINIRFTKGSEIKSHSFDGRGGILAYSEYPIKNKNEILMCFDKDEDWTIKNIDDPEKINLLDVALHEIGHGIGLSHSSNTDTIMYYLYHRIPLLKLQIDDINRAIEIYGKNEPKSFSTSNIPDITDIPETTTQTIRRKVTKSIPDNENFIPFVIIFKIFNKDLNHPFITKNKINNKYNSRDLFFIKDNKLLHHPFINKTYLIYIIPTIN